MYKKILTITLLLLMTVPAFSKRKKTVAVMNFANYGGSGMKYMSKSVPESISASLSEIKSIRVVERRQLRKVVKEISLEQSGVIDSGVSRAGKILKADILILGSIAGDPSNIIVTIKAVEVATGKVITGKVVKTSLAKLFEMTNQAAKSMGAIISGKGIGRVTVSTTPHGSDVYIDGMFVGKSPVVEYKVIANKKHRVKVTQSGYMADDTTFTVSKNRTKEISLFHAKDKWKNRGEMSINISYLFPLGNDALAPNLYYLIAYGHSFDRFIVSGEMGFTYFHHDQDLLIAGEIDTVERHYRMFTLLAHIKFVPFRFKYLMPYAGGFLGLGVVSDFKGEVRNEDTVSSFTFGGTVGANVIPFSKVSLFIESRFFYNIEEMTRKVDKTAGYSAVADPDNTETYNLMGWSIGGGVKLFF